MLLSRKTATGIRVPEEVVARLDGGRRPRVHAALKRFGSRSRTPRQSRRCDRSRRTRSSSALPPPPPPRPPPDRSTGLLIIAGPLRDDAAIKALLERLCAVIDTTDAATIAVDVHALPANCRSLDALARLQLTARRNQRRIRLQRAAPALRHLLDFAGLADVVPT